MRSHWIIALLLVGCAEGGGGVSPEGVARIEVAPEYSLLTTGSSRQLSAVAYGLDGAVMSTGGKVTWESTDSAAVAVDRSGRVIAKRPGGSFVRASLGTVSAQAIVEVPITGTWTLRTANALQVPATLNPTASCAPMGVGGSGAYTVESGRLVFDGTRVELRVVYRQRCGNSTLGGEGWPDISYVVTASQVTFLTGGTDPSFARIMGTIDGSRILVQMPTKTVGTYEAVFTK